MDPIAGAFATPFANPLIPRFPIEMRDTEILTVVYRTDPQRARALVPELLELLGDLLRVRPHVLPYAWVHACWRGAATMELRANAQAPVYRLPVRDVVEGFYWRVSFVLPFGEVIHDYLSPREAPHA